MYLSIIVILSLAYTNFRIEKIVKKIILKVATGGIPAPIKEDISILLLRKDFKLNVFG